MVMLKLNWVGLPVRHLRSLWLMSGSFLVVFGDVGEKPWSFAESL